MIDNMTIYILFLLSKEMLGWIFRTIICVTIVNERVWIFWKEGRYDLYAPENAHV